MGLFTDWLKGPEDKSLEGRKNKLAEARRKAAPIKVMKMEPAGTIETPEQKRAREIQAARQERLGGYRGLGNSGSQTPQNQTIEPQVEPTQDSNPKNAGKPSLDDLLGQVQSDSSDKNLPVSPVEGLKVLQSKAKDQSAQENLEDIRSTMRGNALNLYDQLMAHNEMGEDAVEIMESQNPELAKMRGLLTKLVTNATRRKGHENDNFDAKKTFARLIALGSTYEGRNRRGQGARSLGYEQVQQLLANKDNLIKEYGNGTPDEIRKMVNNRLIVDTPMEDVIEFYKSMPPKFQRIFAQGSAIQGPAPFLDDDGKVKQMNFSGQHFLGDENGVQKRGNAGQTGRKLLQLKRLMDQGFIDPYTGLPMSPDRIELDHVRAIQNPDEGQTAPLASSFPFREHPDNWLHADAGVNSMKDNLSMKDFLENVVEPLRNKSREDYNDLGAIQESGKTHASSVQELIKSMLLDENGYMRQDLDPKMIDSVIGQEGDLIKSLKDAGIKQGPRFAKEFFSNFRGGGRGKKIVREQTGVKNQFSTPPWAYIPLIRSLVGKSNDEQDAIANGWNQSSLDAQKALLSYMEDESGEDPGVLRGSDGKLNVSGSYSQIFLRMIKNLGIDVSNGLSPRELKKLRGFIGEGMILSQDLINEALMDYN